MTAPTVINGAVHFPTKWSKPKPEPTRSTFCIGRTRGKLLLWLKGRIRKCP